MPLLESVGIRFMISEAHVDIDIIKDPYLPTLRGLSSNCSPWPVVKGWLKPTLVDLKIRPYYSSFAPPVTEWVEILRSLPSLKSLSLSRVLGPVEMDSDVYRREPDRLACLPCLQELRLDVTEVEELDACAYLVHHIEAPWQTKTTITSEVTEDHVSNGSTLPHHKFLFSTLALWATNAL
ncbi:uncharacterized protein PHACADRAFT_210634 [Phanerochaete carnosa HHB-10118-sp]|uniref:Uncharacterized protein n=1 Tax=Phanerochaete carnosa (strain HHB-10118-sp) TaxID=650164 RepID=K5W7D0_PHACS|nr:uncharacterized protein PHACADRAFT_210634 [Phanerochaete carnosa HHB-10118-sp]EKM54859.1 hypothetical protein PHACADRAFT_210634 [Phanerochaete carnosa HHB-10118-sp]